MTIIERALKKHRPAAEAALGAAKPNRVPGAPASALDPALRLPRHPAAIEHDSCRERRLLVASDSDDDKAYVAAYRMLRTRLLHKARAGSWTSIAVTSAGPNDGKTLTVLNLALSLAREKTRDIVLLDMDMRNPSVCRALGVQPALELRDYLEHGGNLKDLFFSVEAENLLVAGSVTTTEHASELLSSSRFDELIDTIRRGTVDPIVLIDLPPVLVTDDALVVAPKIDAVLVVASEGFTNRSELAKALDLLSEFPLAGVVLNRAADASLDYNYAYESESSFSRKKS
jgi:capsular exopolysaccharide synthesis family protein